MLNLIFISVNEVNGKKKTSSLKHPVVSVVSLIRERA